MAVFGEADIDDQLSDWGHTIIALGKTKPCIIDERDVDTDPAGLRSSQTFREIAVTVKLADFATLRTEDTIQVDGVLYKVFRRALPGDGTLRLEVRKA